VPLIASNGTLGALVLFSPRDTAFSTRHMDALMALARLVAENIGQREQRRSAEAEHEQLSALLQEVRVLGEELTESAVLEKVADYCLRACRAKSAVVWRLQGNIFVPVVARGEIGGFAGKYTANADANMAIGQGSLGRAARSAEMIYIKDAWGDKSFKPWLDLAHESQIRSVLALPLLAELRATMVLELYADEVDAFSDQELARIGAFVPHARAALRNAVYADSLRGLARDRALAISAASGISRGLDETEVVRSIAHAAADSLGALFAIAYIGEGTTLRSAGGWNAPPELPGKLSINAADPAFSAYPPVQATREGRFSVRHNVTRDAAWIRLGWEQLAREHGFNAVSAFPLLKNGRPLGAIALFYAEQPPTLESEEEIVRQLGVQGGAALDAARSYEQAKSARNFLDRILEESNDAIVQFDLRGNVVAWNKGAERIFGMTRDEAVGSAFHELPIIPADRRDDIREMLSRVGRGENVHVFEVDCRSRDGRALEVLLSASPARDQYGQIVGLVAFSKDISEQKKQSEQLQRQNASLIVMRDVVRSLTREVSLGALCNKGLEKLLEVLRLEAGRLYLYDAPDFRLHNVAQRGFAPEGSESVSSRPAATGDDGALSSSIAYRQTILTDGTAADRLEHPYFSSRAPSEVSAALTKPLAIGDDIVGAVQVFGFDGRRFSVEDQSVFHAVTDELAVALRHARTIEETSRMAITDPLTGLYNYRFTQDFLRKRLSESRRRKRPLSIVMADVDGLQSINERYGRDFGDMVLREFGQRLAASVRLSDVVARYGGDEFIVLLPETQLSDAVMLAERMAQAIAQYDWTAKDGELNVTASLGCASFPEAGSQMQMLLKAADAALYRAKQAGKNTVFPRLDSLPRFAG
jgi:diguanylate cyclase (GGDEF)-like protein/PAS domain S-box-containing protein